MSHTPEDKAKELVEKFMYEIMVITNIAERFPVSKACAIICVEEIRNTDAINYEHDDNFWNKVLDHLKTM